MKHITNISFITLLMLNSIWSFAQPGGPDGGGEKIKRLRVAFITERLDLSVEESEKFWPVFNKYDKIRNSTKLEMKSIRDEVKNDQISADELMQNLTKITDLRKKEADNDLQMMQELVPILGPDKAKILVGLEEEFKRKLIDKIQERRTERGDRPPLRRN